MSLLGEVGLGDAFGKVLWLILHSVLFKKLRNSCIFKNFESETYYDVYFYTLNSYNYVLNGPVKLFVVDLIWAVSWQNQHNGFATSMDPDQPLHPRILIRIHTVRLQTL
jgi:hypothetical protein